MYSLDAAKASLLDSKILYSSCAAVAMQGCKAFVWTWHPGVFSIIIGKHSVLI